MEVHFILVRPVVPENTGFVCRALKNMGFSSLRIVDSDTHTRIGASHTAFESHDILEATQAYDTLEAAIQGVDLVIGTTAKSRKLRHEYLEPKELPGYLGERTGTLNSIAIVFGSESNGLSSDEEKLCDLLSTIPMATSYPSLNLSHSVMIYAYELSGLKKEEENTEDRDETLFTAFKEQVDSLLIKTEVKEWQPGLYQHAKDRLISLKPSDMRLFMSLARYLRNFIK